MMLFSMKSMSVRKVDELRDEGQEEEEEEEEVEDCRRDVIIREEEEDGPAWTSLTVWRKSLVLSCEGFTVIDSNGGLAFRVDNYNERRPHQLTLMDASGNPLLTMCRPKKLRLVDKLWLVYEGEVGERSSSKKEIKPIYCVRKHVNILQPNPDVLADVYSGPSDKKRAYVIYGRYAERSCRVLDDERRQVVAEIKRKEPINHGASFGLEVFLLIVRPGFSPAFAMAMVLLLDQMFS
ncbi:protein LURP-one-related 17-like [Diospyros lotus]|uniref:protein LURP-one-related 17-like n=1 Tax=Diospyros lotus TaxID=55363 RepID=UPI002250E986|nr:protein LURP-one-related 17-like [Diospyros lotus]